MLCQHNETRRCWVHGGWIEVANYYEQRAAFADLMAASR